MISIKFTLLFFIHFKKSDGFIQYSVNNSKSSKSVQISSLYLNETSSVCFVRMVVLMQKLPVCRNLFPLLHADKQCLRNPVINSVPGSYWQGI